MAWYPIYDDTSKDVKGGGDFADPGSIDPGTGNSLGEAQNSTMPLDLIIVENEAVVYNYAYNTTTNLVEAKA